MEKAAGKHFDECRFRVGPNLTSATNMGIPELKPVCIQAMEEAFKVAVASGISLDREAVLRGMELISQSGGTGDNKSSLCVDLLNHKANGS